MELPWQRQFVRLSSAVLFTIFLTLTASASYGDEVESGEQLAIAAVLSSNLPVAPSPYEVASVNRLDLAPPAPKRLFGIIPNNRADQYRARYTPLTAAEKFEIARQDSFDWPNYFLLMGFAAQSEMAAGTSSHTSKLRGFGEFYSRSVADQIIGSYFTEAMLPTLLHEDPRYFRLGEGSVWARAYHAASSLVISRRDNGGRGFAFSETLGNAGVVAIGTLYYSNNQTAGEAAERYALTLGNDAISNLLTEFWPDIKRHLPSLHRH